MSKAATVGWIAAAVMIGLTVSGAGAQDSLGNPIGSGAQASTSPATPPSAKRAESFVPPVRRVRPKTPPGPVSARRAKRAAPSKKGSAGIRSAAVSKVAAGAGCEHAAPLDRKLRRCEPKNGAKAARHPKGAALPHGSAASQTR
jgi:hypothetical protein